MQPNTHKNTPLVCKSQNPGLNSVEHVVQGYQKIPGYGFQPSFPYQQNPQLDYRVPFQMATEGFLPHGYPLPQQQDPINAQPPVYSDSRNEDSEVKKFMSANMEQENTFYDPKEKKKRPKDLNKLSADEFMIHFNVSLSQVFRGHGVTVNNIQPGDKQGAYYTTQREISRDSLFRKTGDDDESESEDDDDDEEQGNNNNSEEESEEDPPTMELQIDVGVDRETPRGIQLNENAATNENYSPERLTEANDKLFRKLLRKFDSLRDGTTFKKPKSKKVSFIVLEDLVVGWYDVYVINGIFFEGYLLKVPTPTSNVYIFLDPTLVVTNKFFKPSEEPGKVRLVWPKDNNMPLGIPKIMTLSHMTRGEVFDNNQTGVQGFICYIATNTSTVRLRKGRRLSQGWLEIEKFYPRFEPATISSLYIEKINEIFRKPKEVEEGSFLTCLINPYKGPQGPLTAPKSPQEVFGMKCFVASIATQFGTYTLLVETEERLHQFQKELKLALDIARELEVELSVFNFGKVEDENGNSLLCLPNDVIFKLYRGEDGPLKKKDYSKENFMIKLS